jgi:hypothetical protein
MGMRVCLLMEYGCIFQSGEMTMGNKKDLQMLLDGSFAFLLERGFRGGVFDYFAQSFGNWKFVFAGDNCTFEVYCDRGEVDAAFLYVDQSSAKGFSLAAAIYMVTSGNTFFGSYFGDLDDKKSQIDRIARILEHYIDEILSAMPSWRNRSDLIDSAIQAVYHLTIEEYERNQNR